VPARERRERLNVEFLGQRGVDGDALSGMQEELALNVQGDPSRGLSTQVRSERTTRRA
jgi:hypothetical protein